MLDMEKRRRTAPEVFADLLQKYPVVAVPSVGYYPLPHGIPSKNTRLVEYHSIFLAEEFREGRWPVVSPSGNDEGSWRRDDRQMFAVGSLAYIWCDWKNAPRIGGPGLWVKYLVYEQENQLKDLVKTGLIMPMAMVMLDLDCPNTQENLSRVTTTLEKKYGNTDWTVIDSGGSFYVVFDTLVGWRHLPWHYGKLVESFADTAVPSRRHIFAGIARDLQRCWTNSETTSRLCWDILSTICHYDEPVDKGMPFMVDLRYVAHSLLEWLNFMKFGEGGFGYLRVSSSVRYGRVPIEAARHIGNGETRLWEIGSSSQLRLTGM